MTNISNTRLKRAMQGWWKRAERARWQYATLGRLNADGSVTVAADRNSYVWVTMNTGTLTQAYNKGNGAVPLRAGLPVRVREDGGRLIVDGEDTSGLLEGDANAPGSVYSVNDIGPDSHGNVALDPDDLDDTSTTHKFTTAADITKLAGIEALADVTDAGNVGSSIHGATLDLGPLDADEVPGLNSASSFALIRWTWTTIKAFLKTYFDTLYNLYVHPNHTGDVTSVGDGATTIVANAVTTTKIINDAVTFAKMQNIATDSLIGRDTASSGDPENILLNTTLSMDGSGNLQRAALTGDVTASAGSNATAIGANKVLTAMIADAQLTLAKMANLAADTIIGRANGAGTGVPQALTAAQVAAIIQSVIDHGSIAGLSDDDHAQYALLAGRSGGQTINGGNAANEDYTIRGTSHATKTTSYVILQDTGGFVAVGHATPTVPLHVASDAIFLATFETLGSTKNAVVSFVAPTGKNTNFAFYEGATLKKELRYDATSNGFGIVESDEATFDLFVDDATGKVIIGLTSAGASVLGIQAGSSTNDAAVGGVLYVDSGSHANGTTVETDLATYTVPADTLAVNNQSLVFKAWGTAPANGNTKTVRVKFGTDSFALFASSFAASAFKWVVNGTIIRTGAATQDVLLEVLVGSDIFLTVLVDTATRTLSGSNVLKLTGQGGATNDVVQEGFKVWWEDQNT